MRHLVDTGAILSYTANVQTKTMASKSAFVSKFHKEYESLTKAIQGDIDLEVQHPRLYQKLIRFYEDRGVQLYDDPEDDYNVILDSVEADLIDNEVF